MRESDYLVDIGPGAGVHGGEVVCAGTVDEVLACEKIGYWTVSQQEKEIPIPRERRKGNGHFLEVIGARKQP
jgi:excinuclease ABC subunit A